MSDRSAPSAIPLDDIDLGRYIAMLVRRWRLIAAAALVGIFVAILLTYTAPRLYESEALLQLPAIRSNTPQIIQPGEVSEVAFATTAAAIQLISSPDFIQRAAETATIAGESHALRGFVRLQPLRDARMIRLRARSRTPAQAQAFGQAIADHFVVEAGRDVAERRRIVAERLGDMDGQIAQIDRLISLSQNVIARQLESGRGRADGFAMSFALNAAGIAQEVRQSLAATRMRLQTDLQKLVFPAIISGPTLATGPVSPRPVPNILVGLIAGLVVGSVFALSLYAFSDPARDRVPAAVRRLAPSAPSSQQSQAGK